MSELIATPIVKNKFWVVEDQGEKIATIQARDDGGYVYVHDDHREYFSSTKHLKQQLNIKFSNALKKKKEENNSVYGYPIKGRSYNQVYDVIRKLPVYSKTPKSKSLFCAGYYLVKLNSQWSITFCPKNITLNRYEFIGPAKTDAELQSILKERNASS